MNPWCDERKCFDLIFPKYNVCDFCDNSNWELKFSGTCDLHSSYETKSFSIKESYCVFTFFAVIFYFHSLLRLYRLNKNTFISLYTTYIPNMRCILLLHFSLRAADAVWLDFNPVCSAPTDRWAEWYYKQKEVNGLGAWWQTQTGTFGFIYTFRNQVLSRQWTDLLHYKRKTDFVKSHCSVPTIL